MVLKDSRVSAKGRQTAKGCNGPADTEPSFGAGWQRGEAHTESGHDPERLGKLKSTGRHLLGGTRKHTRKRPAASRARRACGSKGSALPSGRSLVVDRNHGEPGPLVYRDAGLSRAGAFSCGAEGARARSRAQTPKAKAVGRWEDSPSSRFGRLSRGTGAASNPQQGQGNPGVAVTSLHPSRRGHAPDTGQNRGLARTVARRAHRPASSRSACAARGQGC